jgi:REP element-mobilizing transposase RayT
MINTYETKRRCKLFFVFCFNRRKKRVVGSLLVTRAFSKTITSLTRHTSSTIVSLYDVRGDPTQALARHAVTRVGS